MSGYYKVLMDGYEIYDPSHKETNLLGAKITAAVGEAGSFDFILPVKHVYAKNIIPYGSTIEVFEDGESVFYGRPTPFSTDIYGQKSIHCEGALAFLNDVICPPDAPGLLTPMTDGEFYAFLINYYNSQQIRDDRKLVIGTAPTGGTSRIHEWSYRSCMEEMKSDVLPYTGGILMTRRENGHTVVDWINEYTELENQPIKLGFNLLDLSSKGMDIYTAAIAKGGEDADGNEIKMPSPVTLSGETVGKYGFLCAYLEFPTINTYAELVSRCAEFLASQQFNGMTFEINAVDIHVLDSALYNRFKIATLVNATVPSSGEVYSLPVSKIEIDIARGIKKITTMSPDWPELKQWMPRKGITSSVNNIRMSVNDLKLPALKTPEFESILIRDPDTGNLQSVQISGTELITTTIPDMISIEKIGESYKIGDLLDYADFNVIKTYANGLTETVPLSQSGLVPSLPDGYQFTGNDPDFTVYGNIGGRPYSASIETPKEKRGIIINMYIKSTGDAINKIYSVGEKLNRSLYRAMVVYEDLSEEDVSSLCEWSLSDGFLFEDTNHNELAAIYNDNGYDFIAYQFLMFGDANLIYSWIPTRSALDLAISLNGNAYYNFKKVYENPDIMAAVGEYSNYPCLVNCGAYNGWNSFEMAILIDAKHLSPWPYQGRILHIYTDVYGDRYKNANIFISEGGASGVDWSRARHSHPPESFLHASLVGTVNFRGVEE